MGHVVTQGIWPISHTADALPHGVLEEHPELGHFGPLQDPAAMAASISAALG